LKKAVEYTCKFQISNAIFLFAILHLNLAAIHPICLPTPDLPPLETGETMYITGFGRTLLSKISPIKQKLRLPLFDHQECKRKFASKRVQIKNDQICAGGGRNSANHYKIVQM
jgi:Trypsin